MHLLFKIITQKPIELDIPLHKMQQFPLHEDYLIEGKEIVLIYKFKPTKSLDVEKYKEYLISFFKKKYKAYSVTVGELQEQLKS